MLVTERVALSSEGAMVTPAAACSINEFIDQGRAEVFGDREGQSVARPVLCGR